MANCNQSIHFDEDIAANVATASASEIVQQLFPNHSAPAKAELFTRLSVMLGTTIHAYCEATQPQPFYISK